jgi:hypothetical protein
MRGLDRYRRTLPSGLLTLRGGKAVMTTLRWDHTQEVRRRSNIRAVFRPLAKRGRRSK